MLYKALANFLQIITHSKWIYSIRTSYSMKECVYKSETDRRPRIPALEQVACVWPELGEFMDTSTTKFLLIKLNSPTHIKHTAESLYTLSVSAPLHQHPDTWF